MNDDITGIFDELNPDDFHRTTSAVHEYPLHDATISPYHRFVSEQINHVRFAFAAADGEINSVAVLANATTVRVFTPQDDEMVRDYTTRLATEAKLMGACWLFISTKTKVGVVLTGILDKRDEVYVDDKATMAIADEVGSSKEAIYWYSERRDEADTQRRHGYLEIAGSDRLGAQQDGELDQPVKAYGSILGPVD